MSPELLADAPRALDLNDWDREQLTRFQGKAGLPKNSVGSKQIKSNAVASDEVKNGSLKAGDFAKGVLPGAPVNGAKGDKGDKGDKGEPADLDIPTTCQGSG